jgi:hypothetical protein
VFCAATRGGGAGRGRGRGRVNPSTAGDPAEIDAAGRGRGRGEPSPGQDSAEAMLDAAAARWNAADAAQDAVKDAGDQLADAVGGGVSRAEGAAASTQSQGAVSINISPVTTLPM